MMKSAARSLTEPPGLRNSALPRIVQPVASEARRSFMRGVLPIVPTKPSRMSMVSLSVRAPLGGLRERLAAGGGGGNSLPAGKFSPTGGQHIEKVQDRRWDQGIVGDRSREPSRGKQRI